MTKPSQVRVRKVKAWAIISKWGRIEDASIEDGCGGTDAMQIMRDKRNLLSSWEIQIPVTITYSLPVRKKRKGATN